DHGIRSGTPRQAHPWLNVRGVQISQWGRKSHFRVQDKVTNSSHSRNPWGAKVFALVIDQFAVGRRTLSVVEISKLVRRIRKRTVQFIANTESRRQIRTHFPFRLAEKVPVPAVGFPVRSVLRLVAFIQVAQHELRGRTGLWVSIQDRSRAYLST